jgi:hypothetical protein
MPTVNNINNQVHDTLVSRDFDLKLLDKTGKEVLDPQDAVMYSFDLTFDDRNYGTVVIVVTQDNELEIYFGDNIGTSMDEADRDRWYEFLQELRMMAKRNRMRFNVQNLNRLKYTMQGMAAMKEGLFESYYGTRKVSYSDQPKRVKLVIKHDKTLDEQDKRYRHIESIFVETADGERFKVPSRNLTHGKMLARHVAEGGTPYDPFGQHITDVVKEIATLGRFLQATRGKQYDESAMDLVDKAHHHYNDLKRKAKRVMSRRGYFVERDQFDPASIQAHESTVEEIKNLFVERRIDDRITEALPMIRRLMDQQLGGMKEVAEFEDWTNQVVEGTWNLPDTPEAERKLQDMMSSELPAGADATNAIEQLYDLIGDDELFDRIHAVADQDPNANIWADAKVMQRLQQLGIEVPAAQQPQPPVPAQ